MAGAAGEGRRVAQQYTGLSHPFAPVWDGRSRALVLGTFPSVLSRQNEFYYGHPQNRFWRVLAAVLGAPAPGSVEEKRALLLTNHIALWDVLAACDIRGSADASIANPVPNDIGLILRGAPIMCVFANGQAAAALYRKHAQPLTGVPVLALPSTSPANAAWSLLRLAEAWRPVAECAWGGEMTQAGRE